MPRWFILVYLNMYIFLEWILGVPFSQLSYKWKLVFGLSNFPEHSARCDLLFDFCWIQGIVLQIRLNLSKYDQMLDLHFTSLRAEISRNGFEVLWFGAFEPSKGLLFIEGSPVLHKIFDQTIFTALLGPNSPKLGRFQGMVRTTWNVEDSLNQCFEQ